MKYGKGPRGLIGIALQQLSVKKWGDSLHVSPQILKDLDEMHGGIQKEVTVHKEEKPGRVKSDRKKVRAKLERCIDSFDIKSHPTEIVNISSGAVNKDPSVNVENYLPLGCQKLTIFIDVLPERFKNLITKKVAITKKDKKGV